MASAIPDGITRQDVDAAITDFDAGVVHDFAPSTRYDLVVNGKRYPPKAIVGLAARRLAGRSLTPRDFSGGEGSRCFRILRGLQYDVQRKPGLVDSRYAVITENDASEWHDETGVRYHFPVRYSRFLHEGTKVVYYKGKMKDDAYADDRLSPDPHYFGLATIGIIEVDPNSSKGDLYATIDDFQPFESAVLAKGHPARCRRGRPHYTLQGSIRQSPVERPLAAGGLAHTL